MKTLAGLVVVALLAASSAQANTLLVLGKSAYSVSSTEWTKISRTNRDGAAKERRRQATEFSDYQRGMVVNSAEINRNRAIDSQLQRAHLARSASLATARLEEARSRGVSGEALVRAAAAHRKAVEAYLTTFHSRSHLIPRL